MSPTEDRNQVPPSLTEARLREAVTELCRRDPDLKNIVLTIGPPPMWARRQGFPTLVYIILEQKVSFLASAIPSSG